MKRFPLILLAVSLSLGTACGDDSEPKGLNNEGNNTTSPNGVANVDSNVSTNNGVANNLSTNNSGNNSSANNSGNNGGVNEFCPPEARPVYVVEAELEDPFAQGKLVRWNAVEQTFTEIGELDCPTFEGNTPFSMSVDRDGVAWVLYQSGDVFNVSTTDASCTSTSFQAGQRGFEVFGMGFVLNSPNTQAETLYIAGGRPSDIGAGTARLGYLDTETLQIEELASVNGWPEMSGTAAAELWAFFPQGSPPRVASINPTSGEELSSFPVENIDGQPNAWAFAHWGGNFYLFYKSQTDASSRVFELDGETGNVEEIVPDSGRYIVGAGVSTCAPLILN